MRHQTKAKVKTTVSAATTAAALDCRDYGATKGFKGDIFTPARSGSSGSVLLSGALDCGVPVMGPPVHAQVECAKQASIHAKLSAITQNHISTLEVMQTRGADVFVWK